MPKSPLPNTPCCPVRWLLPPLGQCHRKPPCCCSAIISLHCLAISCISLLPRLGRCLQVRYLCVCVRTCQHKSVGCVLYVRVWKAAKSHSCLPCTATCFSASSTQLFFFSLFRLLCCHSAKVVKELLLGFSNTTFTQTAQGQVALKGKKKTIFWAAKR